jgi:hypothetical protein
VDPDPDSVGSVSFYRIRSAGPGCISGSVSISTKCKAKLYFFPENFNIVSKYLNYGAYDADEKNTVKITGTACE